MTDSAVKGRELGVISVVLACVLFSTSATGRVDLDFPGTSISVGAWRVFLGGIGLAGYVVYRYGASNLRILMKLPIVWVMATAVLAYQISFFIGAAIIGVAMGTLGALATAPFFAGSPTPATGPIRAGQCRAVFRPAPSVPNRKACGSRTMARPMATRWRWPPERSRG